MDNFSGCTETTGTTMTISGVITTYNRSAMLARAIDSILGQTKPVDELIVVDDGSTDNTREVVARYGSRVRYVYQTNGGVAEARNRGIRQARCEWIAFLDDDDEWLPRKLECQVEAIRKAGDAVLCYTGLAVMCSDGSTYDVPAPDPGSLWPDIRLEQRYCPVTILVRRDVLLSLGGFKNALRAAEDWELSVRLAFQYKITGLREPLVNVYTAHESLSKQCDAMLSAELSILESLLLGLRGPVRYMWKRRILSVMFYRAAVSTRAAHIPALSYLIRSLMYWPMPTFRPRRYRTFAIEINDYFRRLVRPAPEAL